MEDNELITTETESNVVEYSFSFEEPSIYPYDSVAKNVYDDAVFNYSINTDSLYTINAYSGDSPEPLFKISVPVDRVSDISIVDGMIYNISDTNLRVAAYSGISSDSYYYVLDIPPYGSEEYYKCLAESSDNPIPFDIYVASELDGQVQLVESTIEEPRFIESNSSMVAWPLETTFLFIILILLICKNVFRKG